MNFPYTELCNFSSKVRLEADEESGCGQIPSEEVLSGRIQSIFRRRKIDCWAHSPGGLIERLKRCKSRIHFSMYHTCLFIFLYKCMQYVLVTASARCSLCLLSYGIGPYCLGNACSVLTALRLTDVEQPTVLSQWNGHG